MSHAGTDSTERSEPQAGSALAPSSCSADNYFEVVLTARIPTGCKKDDPKLRALIEGKSFAPQYIVESLTTSKFVEQNGKDMP